MIAVNICVYKFNYTYRWTHTYVGVYDRGYVI